MKRLFSHLIVAVFTFVLSVAGMSLFIIHRQSTVEQSKPMGMREKAQPMAQPITETSVSNETSQLRSLSPYDIEIFINANPQANAEEIWRKLGIAGKYNGESHYDLKEKFFTKCQGCEAEIYNYELDGEPGTEALLRISDRLQESCRYLVFKSTDKSSEGEGWKLLGHIDHDFGRYQMPQHFYVLSGGESWLVIRVQEASGSGVALYYDRLFKVSSGGIKEILDYPSEGHQSGVGCQPSREFSGRILNSEVNKGVATITVEFAVSYSTFCTSKDGKDVRLWSKKQRATYKLRLNSKDAVLDYANSSLSENEIKSVYNIDSLSCGDLLKYNFRELAKTASGRNRERKDWLREFLQYCERTPERQVLQQMLVR